MKKINIIGNPIGSSGYNIHTKYLAKTLQEQGYDVRIDCSLEPQWERKVSDSELNMITKSYDEDCVSIFIGQPQFWRFALADNPKYFIGYLVYEGDKIPEYWLEYLIDDRVDQIWIPSKHVEAAIVNTMSNMDVIEGDFPGMLNKIKIVPHGVDLSIFNENKIEKKDNLPFTFVCNKGWRGGIEDRGGVQYLLKAYTEEFSKEDNVRLILKLNPAYCTQNFNFSEECNKININIKDSPDILLNLDDVDYSQIYKLYNNCDVFVCPTRAEGFNIPGLEAHAVGLPTIQTNYGGQLDYMDKTTDFFINYKLEYSKDLSYEGIKWAIPDIKHLRKIMRDCYNNKNLIKQMSNKIKNNINKWSWTETGKIANKFIKELE